MTNSKVEELISKLTLDEKLGMIHGIELFSTKGVERLHIPPFKTSDGPMGCRMDYEKEEWIPVGQSYDQMSYLPSNTALAATWNTDLAYETGKVLGEEARGRGKDMILAPGVNIMRSPLCGRNFEYMGEDPCLASEMVVPLVQGIEENHVSSCVKHYALNNQETRRLEVNVEVSERALREIYLPAFKAAVVKGNAKGIMGAYNKFRGQHCCHHDYLLNKILREEWGFKGITISDWGGVHNTKEAALNGLDIEMSVTNNFDEYYMANPLKELIRNGEIKESVIDEKVRHILYVMNELHMLDDERNGGTYNNPESREKLLRVAQEATVLLKNENNLLPIDRKKVKKIALIGDNADRIHSSGGGSAEIKALYEISPALGLHMAAGGDIEIICEPGFFNIVKGNVWEDADQAKSLEEITSFARKKEEKTKEIEEKNKVYLERALKVAKEADVVIYIGGLNHDFDVEGADRTEMILPYEQDKLINQILDVREDAIVIMLAGAPVDMSAWKDRAKTILYTWYAGMEGGYALAELLFGMVNPSGKLPMTIPNKLEDCSAHKLGEFPGGDDVNYGEDIFVGYRYFDTFHVAPAFPFGYGLSYTQFEMSQLKVVLEEKDATNLEEDIQIKVMLSIKNIGKMSGAETIQLYISDEEATLKRPDKELKAFQKVFLNPGESKMVTMELNGSALAFYSEMENCFVAEEGNFQIQIGDSSANPLLKETISLNHTHFFR